MRDYYEEANTCDVTKEESSTTNQAHLFRSDFQPTGDQVNSFPSSSHQNVRGKEFNHVQHIVYSAPSSHALQSAPLFH